MIKQDLSTSIEGILPNLKDEKYIEYIKELKNENNYKKDALLTAQTLIQTYKHENQHLKRQNFSLRKLLAEKHHEIQQLSQKVHKNQLSFSMDANVNAKIKIMSDRQELYEEKIRQLQTKIQSLEKHGSQKTNFYSPTQLHDPIKQSSFLYNQREKGKSIYRNLSQLRNSYIKKQKRQQEETPPQMLNYFDDKFQKFQFSGTEKSKPSKYNTPRKKNKSQWK